MEPKRFLVEAIYIEIQYCNTQYTIETLPKIHFGGGKDTTMTCHI